MLNRGHCLAEDTRGGARVVDERICVERNEVSFGLGKLLLPSTAGAEALAGTVGAEPIYVVFHCVEVGVVVILKAEAAELFAASYLKILFDRMSALFIAYQLPQDKLAGEIRLVHACVIHLEAVNMHRHRVRGSVLQR
jgi:hypothetical protein